MQQKKVFILDTNVILHDSSCLYNFQEHDIIIPITVLEELDGFKKGQQIINFHARQFVRALDDLCSDKLFNGGMLIGPEKGRIAVRLEKNMHQDLLETFPAADKADHRILNIAYCLREEYDKKDVVLVSKDVNLRMKARSIGLMAEDYTTDHVREPGKLYTGCRLVDEVPDLSIDHIYGQGVEQVESFPAWEGFINNEYLILKNGKKSALAVYKAGQKIVRRVHKNSIYGIVPRNAEQSFAVDALVDQSLPLVTLTGKAGTGKTLLALAAALEIRKNYHQILLTRPIIPLSNRDIGYLPGDVDSKLKPYMQPLYDNLGVIRGQFSDNSTMYKRLKVMIE